MDKQRKILYALAGVAILVFFAKDTYDDYEAIKAVKYKIEDLQIAYSKEKKDVEIDLVISFFNPSEYEFNLHNLDLDVRNDNETVLGNIQKENITISPQKTAENLSLDINFEDVVVNIGQLLTKKEVFIYISGHVTYKVGILGIPVNIEVNEPLNVKTELLKLLGNNIQF